MAWIIIIVGVIAVVGGISYLMFYHQQDTNSTVDKAQDLSQSKYNPNMTRFTAAKEAKASEARGNLLTNVNNEIGQLSETIRKEAEALKEGYNKQDTLSNHTIEREKHLADHESYLALAENKTIVARIASQTGLDPETLKELVLEKARMETQLAFKMQEMEIDVERTRRLKQLEFEFENKMAGLDTQMAEIQHLLPQHLINALDKQLSSIHFEYEQVKLLDDGGFKDREIKRVETKMKALEKNIHERQKNI